MPKASAENTTKLREKMELAVERLLAALDALDPQAEDAGGDDIQDLPHDGDFDNEPSLGVSETYGHGGSLNQARTWATPGTREEYEGPEDDLEPSLGAIERSPSAYSVSDYNQAGGQLNWANSGDDDREDEHDGREPQNEDGEHDGREPENYKRQEIRIDKGKKLSGGR